jgi:hypothetical protein
MRDVRTTLADPTPDPQSKTLAISRYPTHVGGMFFVFFPWGCFLLSKHP